MGLGCAGLRGSIEVYLWVVVGANVLGLSSGPTNHRHGTSGCTQAFELLCYEVIANEYKMGGHTNV